MILRHIFNFVLLSLITGSNVIQAYKILMVCPPPAKSHNNLCRGITETLADAGHELTFISPFTKADANYKEIHLSNLIVAKEKFSSVNFTKMSKLQTAKFLMQRQQSSAKAIFGQPEMQSFINDKSQKFDLVISEHFMNDYLLGFSVKYDCPAIILSPVPMMSWLTIITGNPLSMATVANVFTPYSSNMNLWERTVNVLATVLQDFMDILILKSIQVDIYKTYFPHEAERVPFDELKDRIACTLINGHPTLDVARPLLPNSIEIGGFHIGEPEPLPEDLKKIMDNAKEGVVFFSMGSHLKSSDFSPEIQKAIYKSLGSIKETVLWKYETDLPDLPENVIIRSWLPQTGIMAHPNLKLFISHGGLLSCTEATHFGVPLLIIPLFGDQHHNAKVFSDKGQAVVLSFENLTETSLKWALGEALSTKKYYEKAKENQKLFHDRPVKPKELIKYYAEHVIRTKGAPHLSPPRLPRYSILLIDVALVILTPIILLSYLFFVCCRKLFCKKSKTVLLDKVKES